MLLLIDWNLYRRILIDFIRRKLGVPGDKVALHTPLLFRTLAQCVGRLCVLKRTVLTDLR